MSLLWIHSATRERAVLRVAAFSSCPKNLPSMFKILNDIDIDKTDLFLLEPCSSFDSFRELEDGQMGLRLSVMSTNISGFVPWDSLLDVCWLHMAPLHTFGMYFSAFLLSTFKIPPFQRIKKNEAFVLLFLVDFLTCGIVL